MKALHSKKVGTSKWDFSQCAPVLWGSSLLGILVVGYLGVGVFVIHIVKTFSSLSQKQKYLSAKEKEKLVQAKEALRYSGALTIIIGALAYAVLMYGEGTLSGSYLHFSILAAAYMILFYVYIALKEKTARAPLPLETPENREEIRFLTKTYKKILDVNAGALFVFCMLYTRFEAPSHSGLAVLAWAVALAIIHASVLLLDILWPIDPRYFHILVDFRKPLYKGITQGSHTVLSWLIAYMFLRFP